MPEQIEDFDREMSIPTLTWFNIQRRVGGQWRNFRIRKDTMLGADIVRIQDTILLGNLSQSIQVKLGGSEIESGYGYAVLPWSYCRYNAPTSGPYAGLQEFRLTTGGSAGAIFKCQLDMDSTDLVATWSPMVYEYRIDDTLDVGVFANAPFAPVSGSITLDIWVVKVAV